MKTMTWEEIEKDWSGLQKKHRMEIAERVARYCVGHRMEEVAGRLGYEAGWVRTQLDYAGINTALGGSEVPIPLTGGTDNVAKEVPRLIREYGPTQDEQQSEEFEPYVRHYTEQGHTDAAATRMAKAEWAAEAAVEAGVIKESKNKRDERVNKILFPEAPEEKWNSDFERHMAQVRSAATFLDQSKMHFLRRKSTCEEVASTHEKWLEQVERVLNLHPHLQ